MRVQTELLNLDLLTRTHILLGQREYQNTILKLRLRLGFIYIAFQRKAAVA